jgi:hypothetical protein
MGSMPLVLTNADHVGGQETLNGQGNQNLKGERAAQRDQTENGNDGGCGVDGVEGDCPLVVPVLRQFISMQHSDSQLTSCRATQRMGDPCREKRPTSHVRWWPKR